MPEIYGRKIIGAMMTTHNSKSSPGKIVLESALGWILSTKDYDIITYFDRFEELIQACEEGNLTKVQEICCVREHVNEVDQYGRTPLAVAKEKNHDAIVNYLLCCGAENKSGSQGK